MNVRSLVVLSGTLLLSGCGLFSLEEDKRDTMFYCLGSAAKHSFDSGDYVNAQKEADELRSMMSDYRNNRNYGNAIHDTNTVYGRLALRRGQIKQANEFLLAAGNGPGSPKMDSSGPGMSLAKELLNKGQRAVVLQYFKECARFWKDDNGRLKKWSNEVVAGREPDFGANLNH